MSRWPTVKLGDVLDLHLDSVPVDPATTYNISGVYSFGRGLLARSPLSGGHTTYKTFNRLHVGDIVISQLKAWEGAIAIIPPAFDGWYLSPQFATFRARGDIVDPSYIEWFCRRPQLWEQLERGSRGMGARRNSVSPKQFLATEMPLPPIEEQRRVVRKLNRLAVGEQLVSRLQARARDGSHRLAMSAVLTRLRTWVVDGVPMEPLGALVDVRAGVTLGRKLSGPTVTLPYLRVANVQAGHLDFGVVKEVSILPEEESRWALERGDLLLTEGGDWDKLGRGAVWQGEIQRCIHQNHIYRLRITDDRFDVRYIFLLTQSQYGRDYFSAASKQTTNLASINQRQLKAFPVPAISMANQLRLVTQWQTLSHLAARATARQDQAQQAAEVLLASAMHSEFDGELQ